MSTYFIGDVHGCYNELMALLSKVQFNRGHDQLIFTGDLINRGADSLKTLRFVHSLGNKAKTVLGNHDISLIAYSLGFYDGKGSDFPQITKARDSERLINWLRQQPLLIHDEENNIIVTHSGIVPRWSIEQAKKHAQKAEKKLKDDNKIKEFLKYAYTKGGEQWSDKFSKQDKFRYRINSFTRLRFCDKTGEPDYRDKCAPGGQSKELTEWFILRPKMQNDANTNIIFGHWAALGFYQDKNITCLDSGCVWGGKLTALKVENGKTQISQVKSKQK